MNCEFCDKPVKTEREHYKEVCADNGDIIWECTGWTCEHMDWRKRALEAEKRCKTLEEDIKVSEEYKQIVDSRVYDALRWVAQEARGLVMASATDARHDGRLRSALKALSDAFYRS